MRLNFKNLKKAKNCRSLEREIAVVQYFSNVIFAPLIIRVLRAMSEVFFSPIKNTEMQEYSDLMQKVCLLGTTRIIVHVI